MKKFIFCTLIIFSICGAANANLFNLNSYAYCYQKGLMWSNYRTLFSYIAFDNNYIKFEYSPYKKKFLIEKTYTGEKILSTSINNKKGNILYKIHFNKENGLLIIKNVISSKTFNARCKKIKKRELPKSKF